MVIVLGAAGAGKSRLLNRIAGYDGKFIKKVGGYVDSSESECELDRKTDLEHQKGGVNAFSLNFSFHMSATEMIFPVAYNVRELESGKLQKFKRIESGQS